MPAPLNEARPVAHAGRLVAIDAIRGIAALAVVFGHTLEEALRQWHGFPVLHAVFGSVLIENFNLGRMGVVAFFCVSGYVIPFSFGHAKPVRAFILARFFRLYPAYWVSVFGAVLVIWLTQGSPPPAFTTAANLTMIQLVLHRPDLVGVYWTLFYELVFYGICLGAFVAHRLENPRYLLCVVGFLSLVGLAAAFVRHAGAMQGVPIGLFVFLGIMHLGTLARLADRGVDAEAKVCFRVALGVILASAGPICGIGFIQHASGERLVADITSVYAGLFLFLTLRRQANIATPTMLFLGRISYSLYLFHPLSLLLAVAVGARMPDPWGGLFILFAIPSSAIICADLAQKWVEAPANRLGRSLRQKILGA